MNAEWITCDKSIATPCFVKSFITQKPLSALIKISALGWFTLLVNGKRVTDELFTPAQSDYRKRDGRSFLYPTDDTMSYYVYYLEYDISAYITDGENTVEVITGNGWYRQTERIAEGNMSFGRSLEVCFCITVTDRFGSKKSFLSGADDRVFAYPITDSNIFTGETTDTRLFDVPPEYFPVTLSGFKPDEFIKKDYPPDRIIRTVHPEVVIRRKGRIIFDAGENISGLVRLTARGKSGDRLILSYAEEMDEKGLSFTSAGGDTVLSSGKHQLQRDVFILNGTSEELFPMFVLHAFRYFEVEGDAEITDISVEVIHTDIAVTSEFKCDNEILNWLYGAFIRTQLNNYHGCVPSDCPHRERLGYTGDGQLTAPAAMLMLDSDGLYRKWINDIIHCQDIHTGHIQHTAPFMGGGGGPGGWGNAIIFVPYYHYRMYGVTDITEKAYPAMVKWVDYLRSRAENGLIVREEKGGWCLGDWAARDEIKLPESFVNNCLSIIALGYLAVLSKALLKSDGSEFLLMADELKKAAEREYMSPDGTFFEGVQGADALALEAGLSDENTLINAITRRYEILWCFDTGMFGTYYLVKTLCTHSRTGLAVRLMASENDETGFKYMMSQNATTLFEYPNNRLFSQNHPMLGACSEFLFSGLLGIRQTDGGCGFENIEISPCVCTAVKSAAGSILTKRGRISVEFSCTDEQTRVNVALPEKTEAVLLYEKNHIKLHGGLNSFTFFCVAE